MLFDILTTGFVDSFLIVELKACSLSTLQHSLTLSGSIILVANCI